jgi:transposase
MNVRLKQHYIFFTGDAANLIGVDRSTVNRWLNSGKMHGEKAKNGYWLIPLESINDMRKDYTLPELTEEDAWNYFKTGVL